MDKETRNKQKAAWDKENTTMIAIKLQNNTDAEILAYLTGEKRQTIIKAALKEYIKNHPKEYRYGMRLRGYSPGAQPRGAIRREDDATGRYHDIVVYDRKLSADEIRNYELYELNK